MAENRYIGKYPVIGIRPVIDARRGYLNVRGSLEEQTMNMASSAKKLFEENLRYSNGEPVKVVISPTTIGRVAEAAECADFFESEGVAITLTVTPCWCYGAETMDMSPNTIKGVWGFNGTERPGAVYLASVLATHAQKGLPAFGIYGHDVQEADATEIPEDVQEKLLRFGRAAVAVATMRGKSYLQIGSICMGIGGSIIDPAFIEEYLGMRVESVDEVEILRRIQQDIYDKDEFEKRLDRVREGLTALTGVQPREYRATRKEAVVKVNGWSWIWDKGAITLETNTSREGREFEAEFIRLKAGPTEASIARGDASSRARKADIKQHVRKEGKRVVIQDIPMVDQGQKGYCVVATAARIFAYYGMDYVDQHELASLANSSAEGGTSTAAMAENLKKIGARFQIRIKVLDSLTDTRDFRNLLKAYNRAASKLKKEKVENEYDWSGFWDNADGEVLKLARAGSPSQMDKWLNAIRPYITAGIPVLWSVQLGIVPEPLRLSQTRGGHLRLIIGFDEEKKTLIFSDSWGAAHTEKEMPLADAIAITTGRQVMQPSK